MTQIQRESKLREKYNKEDETNTCKSEIKAITNPVPSKNTQTTNEQTPVGQSIWIQQYNDPLIRQFELKKLNEPHDEQILDTSPRGQKYTEKIARLTILDDILYRNYFGETGKVKHLQDVLPKYLVDIFIEYHQ